jgi:toxin ParE1/3/4
VTHRLVISPRAEADLREAYLWYEQRSAGLGRDFLERAGFQFDRIKESPLLFRARFGPYRLAATTRFPYAIYFILNETSGVISIRRVLHFKQDRRGNV